MLNTVKKSQDLYKNRPWLTFLELVTLGTVVLAVCALLLGCGSDSKPGAVNGKKEKTVANVKKSPGVVPTTKSRWGRFGPSVEKGTA